MESDSKFNFIKEVNPRETSNDDKDRVLGYILSVGASFPSEIARHILLSVEQVNAITLKLINEELLKRIVPDQNYPQPCIKARIAEMWAQGIMGYNEFALRSWFIVTEKGFFYYADKFQGDHRRANEAYLETYPNIKLIMKIGENEQLNKVTS